MSDAPSAPQATLSSGSPKLSASNGTAPALTGPVGGPLPPAHTPLKPHLPPAEVSSARDEALPVPASAPAPTPATAHRVEGDDPATASAASAAVASSGGAATSEPTASSAVPPPAHDAEARQLNGSGHAGTTEASQMASATAPPTEQSTAPPSTSEPAPISAPGTQNPYNGSEEKAIAVDAPVKEEEPVDAPMTSSEQPVPSNEAVKAEEPVASEIVPAPVAAPAVQDEDVEMKDEPAATASTEAPQSSTIESAAAVAPSAPAPAAPAAAAAAVPASATPEARAGGDETDPGLAPLAGPEATEMSAGTIRGCQNAMKGLRTRSDAVAFLQPVDPVALGIPHYPDIVKQPMDLGTVDYKLALTAAAQKGSAKHTEKTKQAIRAGLNPQTDVYRTLEDFEKDVRLVFSNCELFNGRDHILSATARSLDGIFDKQIKSIAANEAGDNASEASSANHVRRESVAGARPKREVHPPPPKDLPYADRPQSASVRRKKSRGNMSAREAAYYDKYDKEQLKAALRFVDDMHKSPHMEYAWVFHKKPDRNEPWAPAYYQMIKQPISLMEIRDKILRGEYEDIEGPSADMQLMFDNCFAFNDDKSEVHAMGQKVKKQWEARLAKLPRPNPPVFDDDDDEDEEAEDDDDDGYVEDDDPTTRIQEIKEQMATLQRELDKLNAKVRNANKAKAATKKRRQSESGGSKKAPSAKKAKAEGRKSGGGGGKKSGGGGRRDEEVREVTYEQKEELAAKITQLPDDRLDGALRIIAEDKPPNANEDEEIELDIDDLSPHTLYKLYRYVVRPKGKKVTTSKLSSSDGRKRGTGGVKRKNLDEEEEAARIARLQAQLDQFDSAPAGGLPAAPKPAAPAAGHDDLVASDSSSGEEDSESDSDFS